MNYNILNETGKQTFKSFIDSKIFFIDSNQRKKQKNGEIGTKHSYVITYQDDDLCILG